jgi:ATP-dependent exoDNAse (exonuclease V) alpha subunit
MRAFGGFCIAALAALAVFNVWQIRQLRQDLEDVRSKLEASQREASGGALVSEAVRAFLAARDAMKYVDTGKAVERLADARKRLAEAATSAGKTAKPVLDLLEGQAAELSRKLSEAVKPR